MNKPECFSPWEIVKTSLKILRLKVGNCHLLPLVCSIRPSSYILERPEKILVKDKQASLFQPAVSAEEKKFYNIDPWLGRSVGGTQVRAQSYKYFLAII